MSQLLAVFVWCTTMDIAKIPSSPCKIFLLLVSSNHLVIPKFSLHVRLVHIFLSLTSVNYYTLDSMLDLWLLVDYQLPPPPRRTTWSVSPEHWWPSWRRTVTDCHSTRLMESNRETHTHTFTIYVFMGPAQSYYYDSPSLLRLSSFSLLSPLLPFFPAISFFSSFLSLSSPFLSPSSILDILDRRITFQLQYQLIFCLWMLSYNVEVVERMKEWVCVRGRECVWEKVSVWMCEGELLS